jgi:type IV pilus assembly protein PilA
MNKIIRKRTANRRGRVGFTLVEVIVVLVILAILAAIAIPALTGYIDKAEQRKLESQMRTQMVAAQTMVSEYYAENDGIPTYAAITDAPAGSFFEKVQDSTTLSGGYAFIGSGFSTSGGIENYEKLTGDTGSFWYNSSKDKAWGQYVVNDKGAIKNFQYNIRGYFSGSDDTLAIYYVDDIDSSDPDMVKIKEYFNTKNNRGMTSGFNFYRFNNSSTTYKRLENLH